MGTVDWNDLQHKRTINKMKAQQVVEDLVRIIEGGVMPWQLPWASSTSSGLPINVSTKRSYSGSNVLLLWVAQASSGYESSLWLGFDQAKKIGGNVRKGEHGHPVLIYRNGTREADDGTEETYAYLAVKPVFNIDQIDGLDHLKPSFEKHDWNPIEDAENIMIKSGAAINYGGDRAFYNRGLDKIQLPDRERFESADDFYATSLHELGHWTGHESRLDREFGKRFGDNAYACEELVAEISCAITRARIGLSGEVQHANYLSHWLDVLKKDPRFILTAASAAGKASDFLIDK
jgi:antirestriction protein ArdC